MSLTVIKNHVFTCGRCVTETVTDIKTETVTVNLSRARTPIPNIIIGPNTSAPIKTSKVCFRRKFIHFSVIHYLAGSTHTINFLIVIKRLFIRFKRSGNYHSVIIKTFESDICFKTLAAVKFRKIATNNAFFILNQKFKTEL